MALQLYGFQHLIDEDIQLMVRAHSFAQAKDLFATYVAQLDSHTVGTLTLIKQIYTGTLTSSGFNSTGIINGNGVSVSVEADFLVLHLDSLTGTFAFTPDTTENSILGDLTMIGWVQFDIYTQSFSQVLVGKIDGSDRAYTFFIAQGNGQGEVIIDSDTTEGIGVGVGFTPTGGEGLWMRATFDATAGDVTFYQSFDPKETEYEDVTWETLNTVALGINSIHDSDAQLEVGAFQGSSVPLGVIGRMVIIPSTDPQAAAANDLYPNRDTFSGATSWTSGSDNLEVWTTAGNATIAPII